MFRRLSKRTKLRVSPLFFVHPLSNGVRAFNACSGHRYTSISLELFELILFYLDEKSVEQGCNSGFDFESIREAVLEGILVVSATKKEPPINDWEDVSWQRAAYLVFSQRNLQYVDEFPNHLSVSQFTQDRRQIVASYLTEEPFPSRRTANLAKAIYLEKPSSIEIDMDANFARRSVRKFSDFPVSSTAFSSTLFTCTGNIRLAETSRQSQDPFFLLNSFYSWLDVYVVVNSVDRIQAGIYFYDSIIHAIEPIAVGHFEKEVAEVVQHQPWALGSGFSVIAVVSWKRYMWIYRHSRAYINLLIQLGEFAQEVLMAAYSNGLGGWVTPAVTESLAGRLLKTDELNQDALYFVRCGIPV